MKKTLLLLGIFCIVYLISMNIYGNFELGHDQARHANDGILWYYYLHGYGGKTFSSFDEFILSFPQLSRAKIAWYFVYDPPLHPLLTAVAYSVFGFTEFAARIPSQLLNIIGIVFLFLIAKEFTSEHNAVLIAATYGLTPIIFQLGRDAMIDSGAASFLIGWMYCTFFLSKKYEGIKRYICYGLGGIMFGASFLTKYPSLYFFISFFFLFTIYCIWRKYRTEKTTRLQQLKEIFFIAAIQIFIASASAIPWISYSWFHAGIMEILSKVSAENWTHHGYFFNVFYLLYEFLIETVGIIGFLALLFFKKRIMEEKHWYLLFYIISACILVPIFLANIQPRYYLSFIAFSYVLSFVTLQATFSEKTAQRIFFAFLLLFTGISLTMSYLVFMADGTIDASGFAAVISPIHGQAIFFGYYGNFDTVDIVSGPDILTVRSWAQYWYSYFFKNIYLFNIELDRENHYANPDQFMFRMLQQLETHPEIAFVYLSSAELEGEYGKDVLQIMNSTKDSFPTYFVIPNTNKGSEYLEMEKFIAKLHTTKISYKYWDFYQVK